MPARDGLYNFADFASLHYARMQDLADSIENIAS
jgi:hypothetical protein